MAQAYTTVVLLLLGFGLILLLSYMREAIAATAIQFYHRLSGGSAQDFNSGNHLGNIRKNARRLTRKGNYQAAGEAYESLEMWQDAAAVYDRGNFFSRAAVCWENAGNPGKAIELYEKDANFEAAGSLCEREGLQDRAAKNFAIAGDQFLEKNQFAMAAECYERALDYNRAGSIFEQAHKPERALACYERSGNSSKLLELLKHLHPSEYHSRGIEFTRLVQNCAEQIFTAGHGPEAGQIMEDCQNLSRAAEIFSACNSWEKAAELYLRAERLDQAAKAVSRINNEKAAADIAARIAVVKGEWSAAGQLYEKAEKFGQAIDAYKKAREFEGAARIYENMGRYIMAGEMYSSSKNFVAAANAYAKAYDWRNAAECFEQSGDLAQAVEAYANAGNYLRAGILASRLTDYARAIEYLQRIPTGAPDYVVGTGFLATAFYYQGHHDMSMELFTRVINDVRINRETLPIYYAYASQMESGDPKTSLATFRQILGVDVHYSDVTDRVQRLEKIVTSMSSGGNFTPAADNSRIKSMTPLSAREAASGNVFQHAKAHTAGHDGEALTKHADAPTAPAAGTGLASTDTSREVVLDGRYKLLSATSQHGRLVDHLGLDTLTGKQVIARTFPRPKESAAYMATTELLSGVTKLDHRGINKLMQYGEDGSSIFTISPTPEGEPLKQWIRRNGPMSITSMQRLLGQLLDALSYAHSHDICHLNLRPEVIHIRSNTEEKVILSGFGAPVRQPQTTEPVYLTMPDVDPQYLAPEQIIGSDVDSRTDVYAFGLVLFFALTGRTPFEVKRITDTQEIARMQVQVSLPRPSNIRATLPSSIDEVFFKCVNKSPLSRYQSVSELQNELRGIHTSATSG